MSGAICGGLPYVWATEPEPERWCYGERKRRTGRFELRGMWPKGEFPVLEDGSPDPVMMWEPVWVYKCDGCNKDRRWMW